MKATLNRLTHAWNQFFFAPVKPTTIGLFRIGFGIVVFLAVLGRYPYRDIFYGEHGLVSLSTMDLYFPGERWLFFRWLPETDPALNLYFIGLMLATLSLIVGFQSRISSILVFLGLMSLSNRNFFIDNAGDDLMRINSLFLMFAPAGGAYSIDRWLRVRRGLQSSGDYVLSSPWAQRLMQLQVAYLYLNTALLKLPGEGWQDGTAIYYALNYLELRRFNFKFAFYYLWQIKLVTYSVLVGEFALAILVWWRKARYYVLAVGVSLHLGINLTMQFPIFQYVMIASLINFIDPDDLERWLNRWLHYWQT